MYAIPSINKDALFRPNRGRFAQAFEQFITAGATDLDRASAFGCDLASTGDHRFAQGKRHSPAWAAVVAFLIAGTLLTFPVSSNFSAPFLVYFTVYLGLLQAPNIPLIMKNDYSYALYLFGFPLQQLHVYLFPDQREWYWNAAFALGAGFLCAMASWHLVELPLHRRRQAIAGALGRMMGTLRAPREVRP